MSGHFTLSADRGRIINSSGSDAALFCHTEKRLIGIGCRTKKFLKKQLRDWLRVVSTSKGVYELRFFNVVNDDADDDDE